VFSLRKEHDGGGGDGDHDDYIKRKKSFYWVWPTQSEKFSHSCYVMLCYVIASFDSCVIAGSLNVRNSRMLVQTGSYSNHWDCGKDKQLPSSW
jgi:hypothetical protein